MGIVKSEEKKDLLKHVSAIHSAAPLTLLQRKINNALLFHAYPMLTKQEEHSITMTELCRMIGYEGHNYDALKEAILGLLNTVIQWNVIGDHYQDEVWRAGAIISFVEIKKSVCTYYYSKPLRELLYEPSVYGRISMLVQAKFSSVYGLALYENCIRYVGTKVTKWFDYDVFRKLMGVMDYTKYALFKDFKKRVIDGAVSEVNLRSSIDITPEYKKVGRKVVAIRFTVEEKRRVIALGKKTSKTYEELAAEERLIIDQMMKEFSISSSHALKLLRDYGIEDILKKIKILKNTKAYQQGHINSPAYLITLLKNNASESLSLDKISHILHERDGKSLDMQSKNDDLTEKKKNAYFRYFLKAFDDMFHQLSSTERKAVLDRFVLDQKEKNSDHVLREFHKSGTESIFVKNTLIRYFKEHYSDKLKHIPTEEEFAKQTFS